MKSIFPIVHPPKNTQYNNKLFIRGKNCRKTFPIVASLQAFRNYLFIINEASFPKYIHLIIFNAFLIIA